MVIDLLREARRHITLALSEMVDRGGEPDVSEEASPVVQGGVHLALATRAKHLELARELLNAA